MDVLRIHLDWVNAFVGSIRHNKIIFDFMRSFFSRPFRIEEKIEQVRNRSPHMRVKDAIWKRELI